jgi:hypothetical protein
MKAVGGLIAVTDAYIETLRRRYPWIAADRCAAIPFSASENDFRLLDATPQLNTVFRKGDGALHAVYLGRGGDDMAPALRILFAGVTRAQADNPAQPRLQMHFVGTDYATDSRARKTVEPIAAESALGDQVHEQTARVPYFEALQVMKDADLLLLIGSDDPQYSASKAYPYLMSGRPLVAVIHERSALVPLLRESASLLITFGDTNHSSAIAGLASGLRTLLMGPLVAQRLTSTALRACSAREMTRRQCELFDSVVGRVSAS